MGSESPSAGVAAANNRLSISKIALFKHQLEKPIMENPDEQVRREQQEYLTQIFDEDFIKEIQKEDRKLFTAMYILFARSEFLPVSGL